jgi:hypothetical protein
MMHIVWQICGENDPKKQKAMIHSYNDLVKDLRRSWQFKINEREKLETEKRRIQD